VWYFIIFLLAAIWVADNAIRRKLGAVRTILWGVGTFILGVIVLPFYIAKRPLKANEVREGGYAWNVLRAFALSWTLFVVAVGLAAITGIGDTASAVLIFVILCATWFAVMAVTLILGYFLRNPAIVERGPTGPLTEEARVV
jgi:hypothetical protein